MINEECAMKKLLTALIFVFIAAAGAFGQTERQQKQ
jgi:hypothetical protein